MPTTEEPYVADSSAPDTESTKKKVDPALAKLHRLALKRFKIASDSEAEGRNEALQDIRFSIGDQWPSDIRDQRNADGVPCLTINLFPQNIRQLTSEQRQQRPAIQIGPRGDGADQETAEIFQGMVRHIEVNSDAEIPYDHAFDCMTRGGFGFWRILTEVVDYETGAQELKIEWIENQFSVYSDPNCKKYDESDSKFRFIIQDLDPDEYTNEYKGSALASLTDFASLGDEAPGWLTKDNVRVAEYFYLDTVYTDVTGNDGKPRKKPTTKVMWAKMNAVEFIEGPRELPFDAIPVVKLKGETVTISGKRHMAGLVRNAKDAQRQFNYMESAKAQSVGMAPKPKWLITEGQVENHEEEWRQANTRQLAVLVYKHMDGNPPPQQIAAGIDITAMSRMSTEALQNMQATTGLNDANLGKSKSDESGKAVLARQKQGEVSTSNFVDNLARSIRFTGRLLVYAIPKVYDTARIQRIINPDQTIKHVGITNSQNQNAGQIDPAQAEKLSIQKVYDIGVGSYDVTVSVGPSYQSKRQEAVDTQLQLLKNLPPEQAQVVTDIVVGNMDIPNHKEIAERIRKTLPPNVLDDDNTDPKQQVQKLQAQLQELGKQHEQATEIIHKQTEMIHEKQIEQNGKKEIEMLKASTQENLAKMEMETKIAVAEISTKAQQATMRMQFEQDMWKQIHGSSHDAASQAVDQAHQKDMATQAQTAAAQSQQTDIAAQQQQTEGAGA